MRQFQYDNYHQYVGQQQQGYHNSWQVQQDYQHGQPFLSNVTSGPAKPDPPNGGFKKIALKTRDFWLFHTKKKIFCILSCTFTQISGLIGLFNIKLDMLKLQKGFLIKLDHITWKICTLWEEKQKEQMPHGLKKKRHAKKKFKRKK